MTVIKWSVLTWVCVCVFVVFQCCTWRGLGSTAGGVLRLPSCVQMRHCVNAGSAALESSLTLSVRHSLTHTRLFYETIGNIVVVFYSQQTKTPAGLHQPVQREASGQTHLRAEGRPAVCPGRHLHTRHRYVLYHSLLFLGFLYQR